MTKMGTTRREFLILAAISLAVPEAARAQLDPNLAANRKAAFQEALRRIVGDAQVRRGRVKLRLPPLIDNGNSVPLAV
ncbi:MAG: sulfur oxidation protein SoxY, partial [Betaproteobacteria bacterium]